MDRIEQAAFEIISAAGEARSYLMEALALAREKNFDAAQSKVGEAEKKLTEGHHGHMGLITDEADGRSVSLTLLFMHAEDQLISTQLLRDVVEEMINMYQLIYFGEAHKQSGHE